MKIGKMVQQLFILIALITYSVASAQSDYVVTVKGDTVKGKVKYLNYGTEKNVQVTTSDKRRSLFPMLQTRMFSIDNEHYKPVRTTQGYTFMKVLQEGYLTLFAYQIENQQSWDGRYLQKKDGSSLDVPNISFKKLMTRFVSECPDVVQKIESGEFAKTRINEIVDAYNVCIANRTHTSSPQSTEAVVSPEKTKTWDELESAIRNGEAFDGRTDALDIIKEIRLKIQRNEKIPNFLADGLKNSLSQQAGLQALLTKALEEIR